MGGRGGGSPGRSSNDGTPTPEQQLRAAFLSSRRTGTFQELATRMNGNWVSIADLRDGLSGMSRDQQDSVLTDLANRGVIDIAPESAQALITQKMRDGSLQYGGQRNDIARFPDIPPLSR